jgi:hypothetical protein
MRRIEIAQRGRRFVERDHHLRIAGGPADLVQVARGVPHEAPVLAVSARHLADHQLERALLHA